MIEGMSVNDSITAMLLKMESDKDITFHLTGSRFYGKWNEKSDYDFFAEYRDDVQDWLTIRNFKRMPDGYLYSKLDMGCIQVWEHKTLPIHVQLTLSVSERVYVRDSGCYIPWHKIPKNERHLYWNALYSAARA